nr:IS1 family transposase [Providencia sp. 21OH12SH02B-Prov]
MNLRNRLKRLNRKTLGYSKSPEMHDKIIGTFIEREYYLLWWSLYWIHDPVLDAVDGKQIDNFIVVPPLFRSEPRSEYSMRVRKNNVLQLPKDKESIFFLKMRAIPPVDKKNENESNMSVVFVTAIVIKVYYRPEGISAPKISDYRKVVIEKANNKWQLNNPTPYYMTIVDFSLNGKKIQEKIMIPPFNTYVLDRFVANTNSVKGSLRFVTDYGSITDKFNF